MSNSSFTLDNGINTPPDTQEIQTKSIRQPPSAYTIIAVFALFLVAMTWMITPGQFSKIQYDEVNHSFIVTHPAASNEIFPATESTLEELGVSVQLSSFVNGDLTGQVSIPA